MLDRFIAEHALDIGKGRKGHGHPSLDIARMIVDINVSRQEVLDSPWAAPRPSWWISCATERAGDDDGAGQDAGPQIPGQPGPCDQPQDNPVLLAADAAEAALRGFDELETTVGVARYAPLNALAILVGSQTARGGVLTQCAVEESINLALGFKGLTNYSETLSVYGTEMAFCRWG
jgi:propanediol dehydratase large subunit